MAREMVDSVWTRCGLCVEEERPQPEWVFEAEGRLNERATVFPKMGDDGAWDGLDSSKAALQSKTALLILP